MSDEKKCPLLNAECIRKSCEWFDEPRMKCMVVSIRATLNTLTKSRVNADQDSSAETLRKRIF